MSIKWLSLTFVFGLTAVAPVFGETIYVSDQLIISLRAGQSEGSRLIRTLKTDTPLEVLEKGKEYFLVKTPEGEQGYVLSQYVTRKTPKPHIIEQLEKKVLQLEKMVDNLRAKENDLEQRLTETKGRENDLQKQLEEAQRNIQGLHQDLESTGKEYAALRDSAANVVEVVSERDRLAGENEHLSDRIRTIEADNVDLFRTAAIKWFLSGAGVLAAGWLLGRMSRKKRNTF